MPEGPEAKIASDFLNIKFNKSPITNVESSTDYFEEKYSYPLNQLKKHLVGNFLNSFTIGKQTFIHLIDDLFYNYHLGMTGSWIDKYQKHCHLKISNNENSLYFFDIRKFGNHKIISKSEIFNKYKREHDCLNKSYNYKSHLKFLKKNVSLSKNICVLLLDQKFFPGIGNYIKSEVLYLSRIHPDTSWGDLTDNKIKKILINSFDVMHKSYKSGGAELKDFKNPFKESIFHLNVYGKKNDLNGNIILSKKTKDQRTTWWCPKIQKII